MMFAAFALWLLLLSPLSLLLDANQQQPDFWLSMELLSVDFRKGCISTVICHQPAFKLAQMMTLNGQSAMMSWPLEGGAEALLQKETPHQFVAHWTLGDPEDVAVSCQILGSDPSFGFARVCDEAPGKRIFQEQMVRRTVLKGATRAGHQQTGDDEQSTMLVQMRGRCFNATLAVRKHTKICPWCTDPNLDIQVVGGTAGPGQQELLAQAPKDEALELHNALILALSGATVFSLTGLCCALGVHWRYRRQNSSGGRPTKKRAPVGLMLNGGGGGGQSKKKRILKLVSPPRTQRSLPVSPLGGPCRTDQRELAALYGQTGNGPEEQRYDIPWDNKYCLVPRQWLADSSSLAFSGGIEPLGTVASRSGEGPTGQYATCAEFGAIRSQLPGGLNSTRAPPPPPPPHPPFMHRQSHPQLTVMHHQQQQHHLSPNTSGSSFGRHDDSGLDSV